MKWYDCLRSVGRGLIGAADWAADVDARLARIEAGGIRAAAEPPATEITLDPATWPEREVEYNGARERVPEAPVFSVGELDERIILLVRAACDRADSGVDWDQMRECILKIRRLHATQVAGVVSKARAMGRLPPNGTARVSAPTAEPAPEPVAAEARQTEPDPAPVPPPEPAAPAQARSPGERTGSSRPPRAPRSSAVSSPPPEPDIRPPATPPAPQTVVAVPVPELNPEDPVTWPQRDVVSGRMDVPPDHREYDVTEADAALIVSAYKAPGVWPQKARVIGARLRYTRDQIRDVIAAARARGDLPTA